MKKLLCAVLLVCVFVGGASAEVVGMLSRLNISSEEMQEKANSDSNKFIRTLVHIDKNNVSLRHYDSAKFYDSMPAMLMALNAGEIDFMQLPECVGEYILNANPQTEVRGFILMNFWFTLSLGFSEKNSALRDKFSVAIDAMTTEGKLALLEKAYLSGPKANHTQTVTIDKYDDAETLRVAVTGDLPPVDYIAPDGTPAGYNTAVLAEIGRRLHVNIEPVQVDAGARAAALTSGRVDCVFWFSDAEGMNAKYDLPEGIILTTPYFYWNKQLFIGLKK
ncbi:MAG: transporter substrate-binding domain-containing protein [Synergistaceae bacterium]|nr:transporter substrate-binding domain-containing protein [Synergistaceae bacterium]